MSVSITLIVSNTSHAFYVPVVRKNTPGSSVETCVQHIQFFFFFCFVATSGYISLAGTHYDFCVCSAHNFSPLNLFEDLVVYACIKKQS